MSQPPRFNRAPAPPGIVYNTAMAAPDAALALAALWGYERRRLARVAGVCVTGGGFKAAVFCDVVAQFYRPGERHGNDALAVGLASVDALPADAPMTAAPVDRRSSSGEPLYARTIERPSDTSLAEAQLRNAVTFSRENSIVLSAAATSLAGSLRIVASRDLYSEPVRRLVIVDGDRLAEDRPALEYLLASWPTEIVLLDAESADRCLLETEALDAAFSWAEDHPVADAYRAYRRPPYAVRALDLAAMVFAVEPDRPIFELSPPGELTLGTAGVAFAERTDGRARRLRVASLGDQTVADVLLAAAGAEPAR